MWIFVILFIADIVVACVYAKKSFPDVDKTAFWLKMLASVIFVMSGSIAFAHSEMGIYAKLILTGLVFGLIGDALLSLDPYIRNGDKEKEKRNIIISTVVGAAAFLLGHVMYIVAFVKEIKLQNAFRLPVFLGVWALGIGVAVGAVLILKLKPGKLGAPMLVYTTGLCAMASLSISLAIFGFDYIPLRIIMFVAPVLFATSDATLGLKFSDSKRFSTPKMRYLTLLTYYPAQMLFSLSIMLVEMR
ncbi:MAG: lysoplasmalogenase [Eubacterium sp.]|nr:lysoplasmalogenase [Eubacterium sp.]